MRRRATLIVAIVVLANLVLGSIMLPRTLAQTPTSAPPLQHKVLPGQTLFAIARSYGITVAALKEANKLATNTIYVGQRLVIPGLYEASVVHVVARGETLLSIAARYGVAWWDIAFRNRISDSNRVYVGQRLVIPQPSPPAPTVTPQAQQVQEALLITEPSAEAKVSSPLNVSGWGIAEDNVLAVDILDQSGNAIGQGFALIEAKSGEYGAFTGLITFTVPSAAQAGRVQIYSIAGRDGAIEHLSSVSITLQP